MEPTLTVVCTVCNVRRKWYSEPPIIMIDPLCPNCGQDQQYSRGFEDACNAIAGYAEDLKQR